jgi:hypothetical protein
MNARPLSSDERAKYEEFCKQFGEKAKPYLSGVTSTKNIVLRQMGIKVPNFHEIGAISRTNPELIGNYYFNGDFLFLQNAGEGGLDCLAKQVWELVGNQDSQFFIYGLELKADEKSTCGFSFVQGRNFHYSEVPELVLGRMHNFFKTDETGKPILNKDGKRRAYISWQKGLYGPWICKEDIYLYGGLNDPGIMGRVLVAED